MSHPSFAIRQAAMNEIPQIEDLGIAAYLEYRDMVPPAIYGAYSQDLRNLGRYWAEADVLVAEMSGEIVGSVQFYADASTEGLGLPSDWAGFRKLAVRPSARGHGIARALVGRCIELASGRQSRVVGIHTATFMKAACHLYEAMGFKRSPEHDLSTSAVLGVDAAAGDIAAIAYRLDLSDK